MSDLHKEINLEAEVCSHLAANGWLYADGDASATTSRLRYFLSMLWFGSRRRSYKVWDTLNKNHGPQAPGCDAGTAGDAIKQRGTLDVLRHGIELIGLRQPLTLAQFRPALSNESRHVDQVCG